MVFKNLYGTRLRAAAAVQTLPEACQASAAVQTAAKGLPNGEYNQQDSDLSNHAHVQTF
jgi:hypothetical protein